LSCKRHKLFIDVRYEGHGDTLGGGNPQVYIRANKASGEPQVMVAARDTDANGKISGERFEYLVLTAK
jgi:hypothetical protein